MLSNSTNTPYPLTPLSMGQILDRSFWLYRRYFLTFVGIVAIVQLIPSLFNLLAALGPSFAFAPSLGTIIGSVAGMFSSAAMAVAVAQAYLGQTPSISGAYGAIKTRLGLLIGLVFIVIVVVVLLFIWTFVPIVGWFTGPGALFFFTAVISSLIVPVIILENASLEGGMRRSWDLARQRFWWLVGLTLVVAAFSQVVVTGPILLTLGLGQFWFGVESGWPIVLQSFVTLAIGSLYTPFTLTLYTLVYFDLRIRYEGFDLMVAATAVSRDPADSAALFNLLKAAPPPELGNRLTRREVGYLAILSLIMYGIVLVYTLFVVGGILSLVESGFLAP